MLAVASRGQCAKALNWWRESLAKQADVALKKAGGWLQRANRTLRVPPNGPDAQGVSNGMSSVNTAGPPREAAKVTWRAVAD